MTEHQIILNVIFGASMSLFGWIGKIVWDAVKEMQEDIHALEIMLPHDYVQKMDVEARFNKIDERFDKIDYVLNKIFDKLDKKVDR